MKRRGLISVVFIIILLLVACSSETLSSVAQPISSSTAVSQSGSSKIEEKPITESAPAVPPVSVSEAPIQAPASSTSAELIKEVNQGSQHVPKNSTFEIHFIDVGQADAALILCDGKAMLIDGGNVADSSLMFAYLKRHNVSHIDYVICTHAHEDHVGGLAGALNAATVGKAFSPVNSYDTKAFNDFIKYLDRQGIALTKPRPGLELDLGSAKIKFLGPQKEYSNTNDTSIIVRVAYGETSFLLTGDAERGSEQDVLAAGYDLSSTLLKVGHHGSESSTTYPFLREIMPKYAVISVGKGNSYGHPTDAALSKLRDADVEIFRTDMHGTVIAKSDGKNVTITTAKKPTGSLLTPGSAAAAAASIASSKPSQSSSSAAPQPAPANITYIGNLKSKKFHLPTCKTLPDEQNRIFFETRQAAVEAGYKPCGNCKP